MKRFARIAVPVVVAGFISSTGAAAEPVRVFAAGSLTGALTAVIKLYKEKTGEEVTAEFGPAGLLRERIESGDRPDVFASANMAHPRTLADKGQATPPVVMARNKLCAKALPAFKLSTENLLDRMLDPKVGIGTSTPKADPGGDYAWMIFERAGKARAGAKEILKAKAQQLVGGKNNPPVPAGKNAMDYAFEQHKVDISLGYCSSRETTPDTKFATVQLPANLAVTADYGLSVITAEKRSHEAAYRFAMFVLSPEAQRVISLYGFIPVTGAGSPQSPGG